MIRLYICFSELQKTKREKTTIKPTAANTSLSRKVIVDAGHSSQTVDSYVERAIFQPSINLIKYYW